MIDQLETDIYDAAPLVQADLKRYGESLLDSARRNLIEDDFEQHWLRASSMGHPAIYLALEKPEIREHIESLGYGHYYDEGERSSQLSRLCMIGDWFEAYVILCLTKIGYTITSPTIQGDQLRLSYGPVTGHVDIVCTSPAGVTYVVECKTMGSNYFRQFCGSFKHRNHGNDDKGYLTQISIYAESLPGLQPVFVCFNRDTAEIRVVYPSEQDMAECMTRVDTILYALEQPYTVYEIDRYFEAPEPVPEIYKRKPTGKFVLPYLAKYSPLRHLAYDLKVELNQYGSPTEYVIDYKNISDEIALMERFL